MQPSCVFPIAEGIEVKTASERVLKARRMLLELLMARCPESKVLQDMAEDLGLRKTRFKLNADPDKCILCGLCVRVCEEVWQARALGFVGRGKARRVEFPFGVKPDFCKECNTCIDLCPMTITPCPGPMKTGEEYLCAQCASQVSMAENMPDTCVLCDLGQGFQCARQTGQV